MARKSKNLYKLADRILFEDSWNKHGSEYMSHPQAQGEDTVPQTLPIQAFDQMANQLTVERPPIEDPKYVPDGVEELSRAAKTLAGQVPLSQVKFFYLEIKKLLEAAIEKENNPEISNKEETESEDVVEEVKNLRRYLNKMLKEQMSDWSKIKLGNHYDALYGDDDLEPSDEDLERVDSGDPTAGEVSTGKDTIKGKHIAKYYGKAGPSGVNVSSDRLMRNYLAPLMSVGTEDLKDAMDYVKFFYREHATGEEPSGSEQAFVSYVLKKVVKQQSKSGPDISKTFLPSVIQHIKEMPDKEFSKLIKKASEESSSELAARSDLADMLREEDPEQFEVLQDLGLA